MSCPARSQRPGPTRRSSSRSGSRRSDRPSTVSPVTPPGSSSPRPSPPPLAWPMQIDLIVEYIAGFAFGLLVFQSLFMKDMMGGSYLKAVRHSLVPEWLSMNFMMAGMFPTMVVLMMGRDMRAMDPTQLTFWGAMSAAVGVGLLTAFPINVWLVQKGLKHGMGTVRALGKGGHSLEAERARWQPSNDAPGQKAAAAPVDADRSRHGGDGMTDHAGHGATRPDDKPTSAENPGSAKDRLREAPPRTGTRLREEDGRADGRDVRHGRRRRSRPRPSSDETATRVDRPGLGRDPRARPRLLRLVREISSLSAHDVAGAVMPPGMAMPRDMPAEAMRDMAAVDPRTVSYRAPAEARGDQPLEPRMEGGVKVFDLTASVIEWNILLVRAGRWPMPSTGRSPGRGSGSRRAIASGSTSRTTCPSRPRSTGTA
ncbi:MAG: DUF4396 domain-containing protein [Candidatus Limnocylindrales bacterium]